MRKSSQNRMTLNFRDVEQQNLFLGWSRNQAVQSQDGMSVSGWIVDDVLGRAGLLEQDEATRRYIRRLYAGQESMQGILEGLFSSNYSIGTNDVVYPNMLPLVQFAHKVSLDWRLRIRVEGHYAETHFMSCLDSVVARVEEGLGNVEGVQYGLSNDGRYGRELIHEYSCGYEEPVGNIIKYVLSRWDLLGNYDRTYALLADLIKLSTGWEDVHSVSDGCYEVRYNREIAERRDELVSVIREVAKDWDT